MTGSNFLPLPLPLPGDLVLKLLPPCTDLTSIKADIRGMREGPAIMLISILYMYMYEVWYRMVQTCKSQIAKGSPDI